MEMKFGFPPLFVGYTTLIGCRQGGLHVAPIESFARRVDYTTFIGYSTVGYMWLGL